MEITFKNVTYSYKNKKVLDKINLVINNNKITGITGDNKTLLCELICDIKDNTTGEVLVGDIPVMKENLKVVRKLVSIIHQDYTSQFFTNSVEEEIMFLISRLSYKPSNIEKKKVQALEMVGLDKEYLKKNINTLTTGEKKLLQIAVSIIYNPDIIIFDEPFTELDRFSTKQIIKLIKALRDNYKKTVIIISNNTNLLYEITDDIVILKKGHVLYNGNTYQTYQISEVINDKDIDIPDLVKFTYLAKQKKVKLSYHRDIRDLIKDVYKHV